MTADPGVRAQPGAAGSMTPTRRAVPGGVGCRPIDDRFVSPQKSGYRDILMHVRMSNGHIAELRLHLAAMDAVAGLEHARYEVRRGLDGLAKSEGRTLTDEERVL